MSPQVGLRLVPKNKGRTLGLGDFAELLEDTERTLHEAQRILHAGNLFIGIAALGIGSIRVTVNLEPDSNEVPRKDAERVARLFVESVTSAEQLRNGVPAEVRALWSTKAFRSWARNVEKTLERLEIDDKAISPEALVRAAISTGIRKKRGMVYRSVTGKLESVNIHELPEFRVYSPGERATRCRFSEEMLDQVKQLLGRRVVVRGVQEGGVLKVESLECREGKRGLLLELKGAWKGLLDEPSEVVIRRMRDEDEKAEERKDGKKE